MKEETKSMNALALELHENNKAKGFYDEPKNIGEMLALIHSEVSEALEADRKGNSTEMYKTKAIDVIGIIDDDEFKKSFLHFCKDGFEDELADVVIRVLDLCAFKHIDIDSHIKAKVRYNTLRPHKHGKKY